MGWVWGVESVGNDTKLGYFHQLHFYLFENFRETYNYADVYTLCAYSIDCIDLHQAKKYLKKNLRYYRTGSMAIIFLLIHEK